MSAGIQQVATNTNLVAEKSAQAAETAKIGGTSVTKAVNQMAYIEQTVNYSAQVVTTLGERLKEIGQIVDTNQVKKICAAIQQMASDSQQIVSSVKEIGGLSKNASSEAQTVSAATEEQSASMDEIVSSSKSLAKTAQDLHEAVSKFRV